MANLEARVREDIPQVICWRERQILRHTALHFLFPGHSSMIAAQEIWGAVRMTSASNGSNRTSHKPRRGIRSRSNDCHVTLGTSRPVGHHPCCPPSVLPLTDLT